MSEALRHELERLNKRLEREKKSETEKQISLAEAKLAKQHSHLDFLKSQTPATIQSSISSAENKQLLLQEQINQLQHWVRYYNDLLLNREELIANTKLEIERQEAVIRSLKGLAPKVPDVVSVTSVTAQWEYLQGLIK